MSELKKAMMMFEARSEMELESKEEYTERLKRKYEFLEIAIEPLPYAVDKVDVLWVETVVFDLKEKEYYLYATGGRYIINLKFHKAINQQMKELGWLK